MVLKVTVRRLPPLLTRVEFEACLARCPQSATLLYFSPGRVKGRKHSFSRAYLSFPTPHEAEAFHVAFMRGWPEWDPTPRKEGVVAPAVCVEPSPYQRMPRPTARPDPECNTLAAWAPFQAFVAELARERPPAPTMDALMERRQQEFARREQVIMSPLLKDVIERKEKEHARDRARLPKTIASKPGVASKRSRRRKNNSNAGGGASQQGGGGGGKGRRHNKVAHGACVCRVRA